MEGINSRLDGMRAAILSVKLPHVKKWNELRFRNASYLNEKLSGIKGIEVPKIRERSSHIFHLYVVKAERRDALQQHLKAHGIETAIHYPTPLPLLPAYGYLKHTASDFPVTSANQEKILSLPMFPELTKEQMDYTADVIRNFYA